MCEPTTILTAISVGTMVLGGVMAYKAAGQAQKYNTAVSETNAKFAETKAVDEERLGAVEAHERRLRLRAELGQQAVSFGAQNVSFTGTALDILGDTAMMGQVDMDRIQANAARRAYGYRMDAFNIRANDKLDQYNTKVQKRGTILSTIGGVAGSFSKMSFGGGSKTATSSGYTGTGYGSTWGTGGGLAAAGY